MKLFNLKLISKVKGLFQKPIPYNPILENGDSSPYFGTYETQKYGRFDTSCCWNFAGCELAETRLETLMKLGMIPADTIQWLKDNRYIDADGEFYLSRRYVAILSGVKNSGNQEINFWNIAGVAGLIPNWMLPYSQAEAFDETTQDDFNNEYFDIQLITKEMEIMGQEFLKRFSIRAESMGGGYFNSIAPKLQTYLKEGSMQIGIPVPQDGSWNLPKVKTPNRGQADHSVELYKFEPSDAYPYFVYDSYEPHLKQLQANYFIPIITRVSIVPITPVVAPIKPVVSSWSIFWYNAFAWITGRPLPYPNVPLGKVGV